jgi:hypothetical protein
MAIGGGTSDASDDATPSLFSAREDSAMDPEAVVTVFDLGRGLGPGFFMAETMGRPVAGLIPRLGAPGGGS